MFQIGEFSKLSGLSIDALRHYENKKLLLPIYIDEQSNYRYYDTTQLLIVNKILALKDVGFTLAEVEILLKEDMSTSSLIELLEEKASMLEDKML